MSTTANFVDLGQFQTIMKDFRNDNGSINWVLVDHVNGDPSTVDVSGTGSGGPDELINNLNDERVQYCITKVMDIIDNTKMFKFVYIHWVGPNVPFVKLGRLGVVHGSIQKLFEPHHDYIETGNRADLTFDVLSDRISETSGTKSKVVEGEFSDDRRVDRFVRGAAYRTKSHEGPEKERPRTSSYGGAQKIAVSTEENSVKVDESAKSAIESLKSGTSPNDWCLITYEDAKCRGPLVFYQSGSGGVSEMKASITEDKAFYGVVQLKQSVDETVTTTKFVSVTYLGSKLSHMAKALLGTHRSVIDKLIGSCHGHIFANTLNELNEHELRKKIID